MMILIVQVILFAVVRQLVVEVVPALNMVVLDIHHQTLASVMIYVSSMITVVMIISRNVPEHRRVVMVEVLLKIVLMVLMMMGIHL